MHLVPLDRLLRRLAGGLRSRPPAGLLLKDHQIGTHLLDHPWPYRGIHFILYVSPAKPFRRD